jgi:Uma2 family endonuclease
MAAATLTRIDKPQTAATSTASGRKVAYISEETYYKKFRYREDGFKYEWLDGIIEKSPKATTDKQAHIAENLNMLFYTLKIGGKIKGSFQTEKDTHVEAARIRVPDMCYFNPIQAYEAAHGGHPVSEFMIEVVSPTDKIYDYASKLEDYTKAGVKIVWLIFPHIEKIYVYEGKTMTILGGQDICSASPVLLDFAITVEDVFKKPALPIV